MKKIINIFLIFFITLFLFSCSYQSKTIKKETISKKQYYTQYRKLLNENKYQELYDLLIKWNEDYPEDPELYIAFFNLYVNLSISSGIVIKTDKNYESDLEIKDMNTDETIGYLTYEKQFNPEYVKKALYYIDLGIKKFPDRLDMHFGRIYYFMYMENYKDATFYMIDFLKSYKCIKKWYWKNYEPMKDGFSEALNFIQGHIYTMLNKLNDKSAQYIYDISITIINNYPDVGPEPYNNIGVIYYIKNDLKNSLKWFLKAYEFNKKDPIVLYNIAYIYEKLKQYANSIKYYKILINYCEPEKKDIYKKKIQKLESKIKNE